jgi:glutamine synthetase
MSVCLEYLWTDVDGRSRSKTMVVHGVNVVDPHRLCLSSGQNCAPIPTWNYDGSSTGQADSEKDTEVLLHPVYCVVDPFRKNAYLVLCDVTSSSSLKKESGRAAAKRLFDEGGGDHEPWFGLEQEYVLEFAQEPPNLGQAGRWYCGTGFHRHPAERQIAEEHLEACLACGLQVSGINAEVAPRQWEFQVGPVVGLGAADQLVVARYLLERVAEKHGAHVNYEPKPHRDQNGSGCHVNFSTKATRAAPHGLDVIEKMMQRLRASHEHYMQFTGKNNHLRLTGKHETSSYDHFTYGVGTRNTSVRIGNQTAADRAGYFEDRRPAANICPYVVTSMLYKLCCL